MPPTANGETRAPRRPSHYHRQSSTLSYNTFPAAPPRQNSQRRRSSSMKANGDANDESRPPPSRGSSSTSHSSKHHETPLPKGQLAILAVIALAEQTALNSISPYLPEMASTFPEVDPQQVGMYVGLIASAFALAQFATNFMWGWASDKVGRKPIILLGTILTAGCFVAFGFCRTLWQAIVVQAMMGLVNGNQGVVSTCLGEITDRSNQSKAFQYLPVLYGLGGITGPIVGGLLVKKRDPLNPDAPMPYPYLLPNLASAAVLVVDFILSMIFLQESLECAQKLPPLGKRVGSLFARFWQFTSAHRPTYLRRGKRDSKTIGYQRVPGGRVNGNEEAIDEDASDDEDGAESIPSLLPHNPQHDLTREKVYTRDTVLLLLTFLIFQLANIAYNSLYPIFAQASPPIGRDLHPQEIGVSLAFAGAITILFQVGIFGKLREKIGNKISYRTGLAGFVVAFILMPFVGYKDGANGKGEATTMGQVWLWAELGAALIIKTIASVGGLTSALLLITNSAPSHAVLGTLNGVAQTLSAGGRAVGPFLSGSIFSAVTRYDGKGELIAFGSFAAIAFVGFVLSFGIRGADLEAEGFDEDDSEDDEEEAMESEGDEGDETPTARSPGERR